MDERREHNTRGPGIAQASSRALLRLPRRLSGAVAAVALASLSLIAAGPQAALGQCQYDVTIIQAPECPPYGYPPTTGLGLNEHGHVVGHYDYCVVGDDRAFLWTPEEGFTTIMGGYSATAEDINDDGMIVGTFDKGWQGRRGFVYKDGAMTELPPAQGQGNSRALAVNNKGEVAGTRSIGEGSLPENAYFWSESTGFIDLGLMGEPVSSAWDLSDLGQVVGRKGFAVATDEAFLWNDGQLCFLGLIPDGYTSAAFAINNCGQIVGAGLNGRDKADDVMGSAFIWESGVMTTLSKFPGYESDGAHGINDIGQIVGFSSPPDDPNDRKALLWYRDDV